jgi:hypothetical protein
VRSPREKLLDILESIANIERYASLFLNVPLGKFLRTIPRTSLAIFTAWQSRNTVKKSWLTKGLKRMKLSLRGGDQTREAFIGPSRRGRMRLLEDG